MKCAFNKCTSWVGSVYVNCKNVNCTTCVERFNPNFMQCWPVCANIAPPAAALIICKVPLSFYRISLVYTLPFLLFDRCVVQLFCCSFTLTQKMSRFSSEQLFLDAGPGVSQQSAVQITLIPSILFTKFMSMQLLHKVFAFLSHFRELCVRNTIHDFRFAFKINSQNTHWCSLTQQGCFSPLYFWQSQTQSHIHHWTETLEADICCLQCCCATHGSICHDCILSHQHQR